ncbi:MAG: GTPase Era [Myxococcales bacterium]|nr:GTPase Era [Myxococcales bacterium]
MNSAQHHFGFVAIVGRPNVGKSTLLNSLLGEKLAITSPRPQTTRNRIPGIITRPDAQIVLVDTPGIHRAKGALNRYMNNVARDALTSCDAVLFLAEAGLGPDQNVLISALDREILEDIREAGLPVLLGLNKIDRVSKLMLLPIIDAWRQVTEFREIVPISGLRSDGLDRLLTSLTNALPIATRMYAEDELTDLPMRFLAAEMIRERLFHHLHKELPYASAVTIEAWHERADGLIHIDAVIFVERDSQKGIVIGKGGEMLKRIGTEARAEIERLAGARAHLSIFVRVETGWTDTEAALRKLGYL